MPPAEQSLIELLAFWYASSRNETFKGWFLVRLKPLTDPYIDPDGVFRLSNAEKEAIFTEIRCEFLGCEEEETLFAKFCDDLFRAYGISVTVSGLEVWLDNDNGDEPDSGISRIPNPTSPSGDHSNSSDDTDLPSSDHHEADSDEESNDTADVKSGDTSTLNASALPSSKISFAQTLAALASATSLRFVSGFLGLRSPILQSDLGTLDEIAQLEENLTLEKVDFEYWRSIAARPAPIVPSENLDLSIVSDNKATGNTVDNNIEQITNLVDALLAGRVQIVAIPMGRLGLNVLSNLVESQRPGAEPVQLSNVKLTQYLPDLDQSVSQDLKTFGGNLERPITIAWRENIYPDRPLGKPLDRPVLKTIANPKVVPQDDPLVFPIEKPGDQVWEDSKAPIVVKPPVLVPDGPIGPEPLLPEPLPPVINNPELPVDVDLPCPVEIDLPKDAPITVVIPSDRPVIEISGFIGVGRGSSPSAQRVIEVDTLQFTGSGQIARYLQMEQQNQDVVITFEGNDLLKVVLKNLSLDEIDNLDPLTGASAKVGNIIFAGETTTSDSFDVFNSDWYRNTLLNPNTTTFLNDLDNFVYGFDDSDDVINGQGGNDVLFGLGGNDLLRGGSGDDILNGGLGHNQLVGNSGKDTFVITPGGLSDVMDFTLGTDKIQLAQGTTYDRLTLTNFTEGNRGGTQVWQGNQLVLRVFNVTSTQLTAEQFVPGQNDRLP
jgi:hypothetical protein